MKTLTLTDESIPADIREDLRMSILTMYLEDLTAISFFIDYLISRDNPLDQWASGHCNDVITDAVDSVEFLDREKLIEALDLLRETVGDEPFSKGVGY